MQTQPTEPSPMDQAPIKDMPVRQALDRVEAMLREAGDNMNEDFVESVGQELTLLHARMRGQHAASVLQASENEIPPELIGDHNRLNEEFFGMLGDLDRLIRWAKSIAVQGAEEQQVWLLRTYELAATARRHEAEQRRIMVLTAWQDVGGEGS